ncbi:MAG: 3-hydroxyacyl-CoA dehydrogenase NAD-binding domain-containing protein [Bacteroidota bacterium]
MKQIGIIGAGTMGAGIAQVALLSGFSVTIYDVAETVLSTLRYRIRSDFSLLAQKGKLATEQIDPLLSNLSATNSLSNFSNCDFIIEAAAEVLDIKQGIFKHLEVNSPAACIFASNTSSLSITEIAGAIKNRGRFVGLHFFNPATRMKLVEVVKGFHTSYETLQLAFSLVKQFGKTPILVKDTPGFIVNRIARPFYGEALRLYQEGVADIDAIDKIVRLEGGFKMGPFELMDLIGIDINFTVTKSIYEQSFHESRYRPHLIQQMMVNAGQLGKKTGRGFYKYK